MRTVSPRFSTHLFFLATVLAVLPSTSSAQQPFITIFNAAGANPRRPAGIGDASVSVKYNFLTETEKSRRPALAITLNFELPTGDHSRQLGSGLADSYLNGILQKALTEKTTIRLNGGILFSGNQTTGAIGIEARGTVFTGGGSLVRTFTPSVRPWG